MSAVQLSWIAVVPVCCTVAVTWLVNLRRAACKGVSRYFISPLAPTVFYPVPELFRIAPHIRIDRIILSLLVVLSRGSQAGRIIG